MANTMRRVRRRGPVPARSAATTAPTNTSAAPNSVLGEGADSRGGSLLADRIYELDEPWRTRFIELIAQRVDATVPARRSPSRTQIGVWLCDRQVAHLVELMLRAWACEKG